jgi:hypothetical protein
MATEQTKVDQAALGSATVAGAVTLALAKGPYGYLSTGIGLTLLFLLLGYYRTSPHSGSLTKFSPEWWTWLGQALAFGAVVGLLSSMAIAWIWQTTFGDDAEWWFAGSWAALALVGGLWHGLRLSNPGGNVPNEGSTSPQD